MSVWIVFIAVLAVSLRTAAYGLWVIRNKNVLGGIYVFSVAFAALALAARYVFHST